MTKFSDHKPQTCKIRSNVHTIDAEELLDAFEDAPRKYRWDHDDEGTQYKFLAVQGLPEFKEKIEGWLGKSD